MSLINITPNGRGKMPIHNPPGYVSSHIALKKNAIPKNVARWIERRLTFYHAKTNTEIQMYDDESSARYLFLPRGILIRSDLPENFPKLSDQRTLRPATIPDVKIKLRPYQRKALRKLRKRKGGVLRAPTGSGKTVIGCALISALQQKTLVIVHTHDLIDQWVKACEFVLGYRPGIIGRGHWEERGITIATAQTLARFDMNRAPFADSYGAVIVDECHKTPAASFQRIAAGMSARYLYGLTATTTRPDGMHPVMGMILGPTVATVHEGKLVESGKLILPDVRMVRSGFKSREGERQRKVHNQWARNSLYRKVSQQVISDPKRNDLIVREILRYKDESVLVMSERVEHLENIYDLLLEKDHTVNAEIVTGQTPKQERSATMEKMRRKKINVMLATRLAKEGLDIPCLNVLILAYPNKSKEPLIQVIGRIMRPHDGKEHAIIVDITDDRIPAFRTQALQRRKVYREKKCNIRGWIPSEEKGIK